MNASVLDPQMPMTSWTHVAALSRLRRDEPLFTAVGLFLLALMIPTGAALLIDTRDWAGVPGWIKPLKFQFALGVYLLSLAFFARYLPEGLTARRSYRIYAASVVAAIMAEMVWVGGATMLGTRSHFNMDGVGGILYGLMGILALWLTGASAYYAWQIALRPAPGGNQVLKEGIVLGLAMVLPMTAVTAGYMSGTGGHFVGTGTGSINLAVLGWARDGGDLRVPHFFATHALHFVPLAGLAISAWMGPKAIWALRLSALVYIVFVVFVFWPALEGRPFLPFLG